MIGLRQHHSQTGQFLKTCKFDINRLFSIPPLCWEHFTEDLLLS